MTTTQKPAPVKGMKFKHAKRTDWRGGPVVGTVTSVSQGKGLVYWVDPLWQDKRMKTPLSKWDIFCAEVLEMPRAKAKASAPKMSAQECRDLFRKANQAGLAAGKAARPTPMHVTERVDPFDDTSAVKRDYGIVSDGVCGFAWINTPGNSAFGRWLKKSGLGRTNSYSGGVDIRVGAFNQSLERKVAYASAAAAVLTEAGLVAHVESRMD